MGYFLVLLAGMVVGWGTRHRWSRPGAVRILDGLLWLTLIAVLGGMAARLGADRTVWAQGVQIGMQALVLSAAALAGSVALVALFRRWLP